MRAGRLQIDQNRRRLADLVEPAEVEVDAGASRDRGQMQYRIGRAADRHQHPQRILDRIGVTIRSGVSLERGKLHRGAAGRFGGAQPVGMDRRDRRAAGQDHAERLGDRSHRARRSHHRAGPGGRREVAFDLVDLVAVDLAGAVPGPEPPAIGAGAEPLAMPARGQHRPGDEPDGRPVGRDRAHQLGRHGLVAAADQHDRIHRLGADHLLGVDRHQVAEHQAGRAEKHLAERDRRKGQRQPAHRQHAALDRLDQLGEVPVAIVEAGKGVGDADHRPRQKIGRIPHRARKGAPQVQRKIGVAVIGEAAGEADRFGHVVLSNRRMRQLAADRPGYARAAVQADFGCGISSEAAASRQAKTTAAQITASPSFA